ncbi:hypothetical protein FACS189421_02690 [Bacteroidia bacterium]|nr:hypothetical protein FACS189421_02690 [Bacteroidia bacterium]
MQHTDTFLTFVQYAAQIWIVVAIVFAPEWLGRKNKKGAADMVVVRAAAFLFGWTGVGYMYALYVAARK